MKTKWLRNVVLAGAAGLLVRWYVRQQPEIHSILVSPADEDLVLQGRGFGQEAGTSQVLLHSNGSSRPGQVIHWADQIIRLATPGTLKSGEAVVIRRTLFGQRASKPAAFVRLAHGLPSQPYSYTTPVESASPWPTFRRDSCNTGRSPLNGSYQAGDRPWSFNTGKGIFSTPVIDSQGDIYFGSADHVFYAVHPDGSLKWSFQTGEIIDSAAALGQYNAALGAAPLTFVSGDGFMYHVRADTGELLWRYEASLRPGISFNRWFEGNVAIGQDGTLYAGNTNFNYYAIKPDGSLKWTYSTGSNNWSQAAFADDGAIIWGSTDTFVRSVSPNGKERWKKRTLGFIAASACIGSDGTVYIGSFDSNLYALDPRRGKTRWRYPTGDHIYSSAALGCNPDGHTSGIYFGSADGFLYAILPDGSLKWRFEAGAPIRSSPAIGLSSTGEEIIYFGCGSGRLYAINAVDGSLRWSYDTTPDDPELRDRNDLNGSPALGERGVYIGGEHGCLWFIPYDYPIYQPDEPRGASKPADRPSDTACLEYISPGGNAQPEFPAALNASSIITLRLAVRKAGEDQSARIHARSLHVQFTPAIDHRLEISADGRYFYIVPSGFFTPGQCYRLEISGSYLTGGMRLGNLSLGGSISGHFEASFSFQVEEPHQENIPLTVQPDSTTALEWTRLAAPLPSMLPSLNQIGFDYMDWIIGAIAVDESSPGRLLLWAIGARRDENGLLQPDPDSDFTLPLYGRFQGSDFIASNRRFKLAITGISIPFNTFELRGRLGADLIVAPGASAFADTQVLSIPNFGLKMVIAGLANQIYKKLLVSGTYITRPYPSQGSANRPPHGLHVSSIHFEPPAARMDGELRVGFVLDPGVSYSASQHRVGILLAESESLQPVALDYHHLLSTQVDANGSIASASLKIPARIALPPAVKAYIICDVYPIHTEQYQVERMP